MANAGWKPGSVLSNEIKRTGADAGRGAPSRERWAGVVRRSAVRARRTPSWPPIQAGHYRPQRRSMTSNGAAAVCVHESPARKGGTRPDRLPMAQYEEAGKVDLQNMQFMRTKDRPFPECLPFRAWHRAFERRLNCARSLARSDAYLRLGFLGAASAVAGARRSERAR